MTDQELSSIMILAYNEEECAVGSLNCRSLKLDTIQENNIGAFLVEDGSYV